MEWSRLAYYVQQGDCLQPLSASPEDPATLCELASRSIAAADPKTITDVPPPICQLAETPPLLTTSPACSTFGSTSSHFARHPTAACSSPSSPTASSGALAVVSFLRRSIFLVCLVLSFLSSFLYLRLLRCPRLYSLLSSQVLSTSSQLLLRLRVCSQWATLLCTIWAQKTNAATNSETPAVCSSPPSAATSCGIGINTGNTCKSTAGGSRYAEHGGGGNAGLVGSGGEGVVVAACRLMLVSSVWLVFVDLCVGWMLCFLLCCYPTLVLDWVDNAYNFLHVDMLKSRVDWLMNFPAGLKLNRELNFFIGSIILTTIDVWNELTEFVAPLAQLLVRFLGLASLGGFTMLLAITSDIFNCCTLHVCDVRMFISDCFGVHA
eukprot:GHVS01040744.1.p1 GENE.GHVS01040744.1~~GHVS01040744.1.p1  ORF type:complete len:378 (+),score=61.64 GHVS01040744.1:77-1210(+)